jgi:hypothetical protein
MDVQTLKGDYKEMASLRRRNGFEEQATTVNSQRTEEDL